MTALRKLHKIKWLQDKNNSALQPYNNLFTHTFEVQIRCAVEAVADGVKSEGAIIDGSEDSEK